MSVDRCARRQPRRRGVSCKQPGGVSESEEKTLGRCFMGIGDVRQALSTGATEPLLVSSPSRCVDLRGGA